MLQKHQQSQKHASNAHHDDASISFSMPPQTPKTDKVLRTAAAAVVRDGESGHGDILPLSWTQPKGKPVNKESLSSALASFFTAVPNRYLYQPLSVRKQSSTVPVVQPSGPSSFASPVAPLGRSSAVAASPRLGSTAVGSPHNYGRPMSSVSSAATSASSSVAPSPRAAATATTTSSALSSANKLRNMSPFSPPHRRPEVRAAASTSKLAGPSVVADAMMARHDAEGPKDAPSAKVSPKKSQVVAVAVEQEPMTRRSSPRKTTKALVARDDEPVSTANDEPVVATGKNASPTKTRASPRNKSPSASPSQTRASPRLKSRGEEQQPDPSTIPDSPSPKKRTKSTERPVHEAITEERERRESPRRSKRTELLSNEEESSMTELTSRYVPHGGGSAHSSSSTASRLYPKLQQEDYDAASPVSETFYDASMNLDGASPRQPRSKSNSPRRQGLLHSSTSSGATTTSSWISKPLDTLTSFLTPWARRSAPTEPMTEPASSPTLKASGVARDRSPTEQQLADASHAKKVKVVSTRGNVSQSSLRRTTSKSPARPETTSVSPAARSMTDTLPVRRSPRRRSPSKERLEPREQVTAAYLPSWSQTTKNKGQESSAAEDTEEEEEIPKEPPVEATPRGRNLRTRAKASGADEEEEPPAIVKQPVLKTAAAGKPSTPSTKRAPKLQEVSLEAMSEAMSARQGSPRAQRRTRKETLAAPVVVSPSKRKEEQVPVDTVADRLKKQRQRTVEGPAQFVGESSFSASSAVAVKKKNNNIIHNKKDLVSSESSPVDTPDSSPRSRSRNKKSSPGRDPAFSIPFHPEQRREYDLRDRAATPSDHGSAQNSPSKKAVKEEEGDHDHDDGGVGRKKDEQPPQPARKRGTRSLASSSQALPSSTVYSLKQEGSSPDAPSSWTPKAQTGRSRNPEAPLTMSASARKELNRRMLTRSMSKPM